MRLHIFLIIDLLHLDDDSLSRSKAKSVYLNPDGFVSNIVAEDYDIDGSLH